MFFSTQHIRNTIENIDGETYADKNSFKAVGITTFARQATIPHNV